MNKQVRKLSVMVLLLVLSVTAAFSQVTTSGMSGRVISDSNEPLPGAAVVAIHTPSGTQYGTITNSEGRFTIQGMRSGGPYAVNISFVGYSTAKFSEINLILGESFNLNATMKESAVDVGEVMVVGTKPSAFGTDKTGAATNIPNEVLTTMPSINRSLSDFFKMSPLSGGSNTFAGRDGRLNNINIDGANFNDNFGLSSNNLPGGNAQPISLDAIEEVQVNIAPFDVRQANFTGAGINAVTKSGTNTLRGSVYSYYRNQDFNGRYVGTEKLSAASKTSTTILGGRLGGAIIKNKLFFFVNGEYENSPYPGMEYLSARSGVTGSNVTRVPAADLEEFSSLLKTKYGYETGPYENYGKFASQNHKILARIDWNINEQHKFTIRYNTVKNTNDNLVNGNSAPNPRATSNRVSKDAMSFQNTNYGFLNTVNSLVAELNSNFGGKFSNQFLATYTKIQDTRTSPSEIFPFIDIWDGNGNSYMSAGYELFTFNNNVINNVLTFTDNFTYYLGKHTLTAGASFEKLYFGNSYMRYGTSFYRFKDFASFKDHINGGTSMPIAFGLTYSLVPGEDKPMAELDFGQFSSYLQDIFSITQNFKLTYGVRIDLPIYLNDLIDNPAVSALSFVNGEKINLSKWPDSKILWSPRVGFSWDVNGDNSLKLRGGTGIFTGRLPFVFFTNQPTNSGMIQNTVEITNATQLASLPFNKDPFYHLSNTTLFPNTAGKSAPGSIASVSPDFKMPQVWRSSLAADIKLPLDMILTLEGLYTKDLNAIVQRDANLAPSNPQLTYNGPDNRPIWTPTSAGRRINTSISNAMVMENTDQGYSYNLTAMLTFPVVKNLEGMIGYTRSMAKDITGNPGSQAASAWSNNVSVRGQNDLDLSYSQYLTPHKVTAAASYKLEYARNFTTTFSIIYGGYNAGNFSYRYGTDFNGDGVTADLIYIPKNPSEITFTDIKSGSNVVYTAQEQANAFFKYVEQDKYLSKHKGKYAERNGAYFPWYNRWDMKILQDFKVNVKGQKNMIQVSADILNAGNLASTVLRHFDLMDGANWGIYKNLTVSNGAILRSSTPVNNVPTFQMSQVNGKLPVETFTNSLTNSSVFGIQLGLRYIFN